MNKLILLVALVGLGYCQISMFQTTKLKATLKPYPGQTTNTKFSGTAELQQTLDGTQTSIQLKLEGLQTNCTCQLDDCDSPKSPGNACGVHVHVGTTCTDAASIGGHYFSTAADPWNGYNGAYYENRGTTSDTGVRTFLGSYGYDMNQSKGHALVVHNNKGARIGCGILEHWSSGIWTFSGLFSFSLLAILFKFY